MANIIRVRGLHAHYKFTQLHKYEESITMLQELQASPLDVINLYPDLAVDDLAERYSEPCGPSGLFR